MEQILLHLEQQLNAALKTNRLLYMIPLECIARFFERENYDVTIDHEAVTAQALREGKFLHFEGKREWYHMVVMKRGNNKRFPILMFQLRFADVEHFGVMMSGVEINKKGE